SAEVLRRYRAYGHHKTALSHNREAAIDGESFVAGKPENRPGDLLRPRPTAEQRRGLPLGLERLDALAGGLGLRDMEIGQRRAGTDRVDAYAVRHFLEGERARHGENAGLGRVVETHALAPGQRVARRDIDDTPAAAAAQRRQRRFAVVRDANEIDADHRLPLGGGRVGDR